MESFRELTQQTPIQLANSVGLLGIALVIFYLLCDTTNEPFFSRLFLILTMTGCVWAGLGRTQPDDLSTTLFRCGLLGYVLTSARSIMFVSRFNIAHNLRIVATIRAFKDLIREANTDRVILFCAPKNGGRLLPGIQTYAIMGRTSERAVTDEWIDYQGTELDAPYVAYLKQARDEGVAVVDISETGGTLGQIYAANKVQYSQLYIIRESRTEILYVSVAYMAKPLLTAHDKTTTETAIQRIRNVWQVRSL